MRIRVSLDSRIALKRRMKIKKAGGEWFWADFKYERLRHLCFIYGKLGHTEHFCDLLFNAKDGVVERLYGT